MVFGVAILCLLRDFAWKYFKRRYNPESYHYVQEIQNIIFKIIDQEWNNFKKQLEKFDKFKELKQRGFAFSQVEGQDQDKIVRLYDTTKKEEFLGNYQKVSK